MNTNSLWKAMLKIQTSFTLLKKLTLGHILSIPEELGKYIVCTV